MHRRPDAVPSRRGFLHGLAAGSLGLVGAPAWRDTRIDDAPPLPPTPADPDERFWEEVKAQFPLKDGVTPMNAANLCPAPRQVVGAQAAAMRDVDGDVSFQNRAKYGELHEAARRAVAADLGVTPDEIALVRNTSEANNIIVGGLPLSAGDEVVVFDQNHPTNNVAWDVRARRYGFTVRRVSLPEAVTTREQALEAFTRAFTPRTRAVAFSDVSNVTGARLPVEALCEAAHDRGIHVHVDGAQTWGVRHLNLATYGCDSYASSAHKWLCGPKEIGLLYVRRDRQADIWPGVVGVGWGADAEPDARGARKFETLGQRDDSAVAALAAAVAFRTRIGAAQIEARVSELAAALRERLAALPGAQLVTPADEALNAGVVICRFEGADPRMLFQRLYDEHGIAGAPTGGLRLCPHVYNTMADVERAVAAVRGIVRAA